ncbi:hypothetical protein [Chitinophaga sp. YIM B06452]|uniref:hypothetical protein n=1 Tax=Chitinophaga sp. YIM B06452 TaxID=3082158 RepID=UPI0031FF09E0
MKMITAIMLLAATSVSAQPKPTKVLYYLDSVLYVRNPLEYHIHNEGMLTPEDVAYTNMAKTRKGLKHMAERGWDSIAYIFTKAYVARSEEEKKIPILNNLTGRLTTADMIQYSYHDKPYTGKIIDYHFNGKKALEGMMENGWKTGPFTHYDDEGHLYSTVTYTKRGDSLAVVHTDAAGIVFRTELFRTDGSSERRQWYTNGKLKSISIEKKHRSVQVRYHSDGRISDSLTTWNRFVKRTGKFNQMHSLLYRKDFNAALLLDPRNADIYYLRALEKMGGLQFDAALNDIDTAIAMEPLKPEYNGQRAIIRLAKYASPHKKALPEEDFYFFHFTQYLAEHPQLNIRAEEKALIMKDLEAASKASVDFDRYHKIYHYLKKSNFLQ